MTSDTRRQVVVSTLAEAQFFLDHGFDDITYAYPLGFEKLPRCAELLGRLELFHITVDNMEIIDALGKYVLPASGKKWSILLMVDCGYGRGNYEHQAFFTSAEQVCSLQAFFPRERGGGGESGDLWKGVCQRRGYQGETLV